MLAGLGYSGNVAIISRAVERIHYSQLIITEWDGGGESDYYNSSWMDRQMND